jgi:AcrR family transcriptional regulator
VTTQTVERREGPRSKRGVILDAAIDYFGEVGFEHTKWATVADQVGIGQTALYHYFESKAHCLLSIMSGELERSLQAFRDATAGKSDLEEALRVAIAVAFDVSPREVLQMRILQSHMDLLATPRSSEKEEIERQRARVLVRAIEDEWSSLITRGMKSGVFAKRDAHQTGLAVLALVVSVWRWYRPDGDLSLDEVRDFITDACLRIVRA